MDAHTHYAKDLPRDNLVDIFRLFSIVCDQCNRVKFVKWPSIKEYYKAHHRYIRGNDWIFDLKRKRCVPVHEIDANDGIDDATQYDFMYSKPLFNDLAHPIPSLVCDIPNVGRIYGNGTIEKRECDGYGIMCINEYDNIVLSPTGMYHSLDELVPLLLPNEIYRQRITACPVFKFILNLMYF